MLVMVLPEDLLKACRLCPRACEVDRTAGRKGFCRVGDKVMVSHYGQHFGEEPPISGTSGSGTVFFSFCNLRCLFCQNWQISQRGEGTEYALHALVEMFLDLQNRGCHNINLVSPTPYIAHIAAAIGMAKKQGLRIPIVYNTNAYESVEALRLLDGLVDIYLPDFKYWSAVVAQRLSGVPEEKPYADFACAAILEMKRQVGELTVENGIATRGLLVRHLVLPGGLAGSKPIFRWMAQHLGTRTRISLMSQYYPVYRSSEVPLLRRRLKREEYDEIVNFLIEEGFTEVFVQDMESAPLFVPDFEDADPFGVGRHR